MKPQETCPRGACCAIGMVADVLDPANTHMTVSSAGDSVPVVLSDSILERGGGINIVGSSWNAETIGSFVQSQNYRR